MTKKMTQKQFKEILASAGIELDYTVLLIQLEGLAWREAKEYAANGCDYIAKLEKKKASAIHAGLEAAGVYDGYDDEVI